MNFWANFQKKIVNQNSSDGKLKVTLLAGVLSSDSTSLHRHEPSYSNEPIDPRQALYGEKTTS